MTKDSAIVLGAILSPFILMFFVWSIDNFRKFLWPETPSWAKPRRHH